MRRWFLRGIEFVAALIFVKWIHRLTIRWWTLLAWGIVLLYARMIWELSK